MRVTVDTGGTFTDAVVARGGEVVAVGKAPTTPHRLAEGFRAAIENAAGTLGLELADLLSNTERLVFGTTHAVNALVQGKVARTALLVTEGFRDVLLFREGGRPDELLFEYNIEYPGPFIPRASVFEVPERVHAEGAVDQPLDEARVIEILRTLRDRKIEAVGVCLIWSVINPAHELRIGELIDRELPGVPYTLSHRVLRIVREYRRASATAIDASLKPLIEGSFRDLSAEIRAWGYDGPILVSTSGGGCVPIEHAATRPVYLLKSGPAMAPVAGRRFAQAEGMGDDVIVCDTGGTTFDVGVIRGGEIAFTRDMWFGPVGTGELVATSSVDIRSVGSGGGSIARVDAGGLLHVGPESAGSDPGPACYARGGTLPTVTDAAALLGYLQPDKFLGGRMVLDVESAARAITPIAESLGLSTEAAAAAILRLANEAMIDAITEITLNVGLDPRENVLLAGGGAAGLNIIPIARELGIRTVLVPRAAGALSACGMQFSDVTFESSASLLMRSGAFDHDAVDALLTEIEAELDVFASAVAGDAAATWVREYRGEARYAGQVWEVDFRLPGARIPDAPSLDSVMDAFHAAHRRLYAFADDVNEVEFVNWVGRVRGRPPGGDANGSTRNGGVPVTSCEPSDWRTAWFDGTALETPVYDEERLRPGIAVEGPAIVVSPTSTLVLDPASSAYATAAGNFLITVDQEET